MRILTTLIAASIVAGCATQAQIQHSNLTNQYNAAMSAMKNCFEAVVANSAAVQRLKKITVNSRTDPDTVRKLANKNFVNNEETKDIIELSVIRKPCIKQSIESFSRIHPDYVITIAKVFTEADADLAAGINRELTIGEMNKRMLDRRNRWEAEFNQINQRITSQLYQAHQYQVQQRQKAGQALQAWSYQQQQLRNQQLIRNSLNRPRTTNCRYLGDTLNCTTF